MLTAHEITLYVDRVRYKPGWSFQVLVTDFESPQLFITARVMNAYDHSQMVDLGIKSHLPRFRDEKALEDWLMWRIERIESHEAREFFTVDGKRPFDPH